MNLLPRPPPLCSSRYKDMYRERVERQYKNVNPHATQQVPRSSTRWLMTLLHFTRHVLISTPAASERGAGRRWLGHICNYVRGSTCWCVAAACDPVFFVLQLVFAREKTCAEFTCVAAKDALADIQEKHRDIKKLERSIGWFNPLAQAFSFSFCVVQHRRQPRAHLLQSTHFFPKSSLRSCFRTWPSS
jgi:hypothetical protein